MASYPIHTIVSQLDDAVSLVISAHTHEPYICELPNRSGRKITVTSASSYGRVLTNIDLTLNPKSKRITAVAAHNILVDRTNPAIQPDAAIRSIVERYAAIAAPIANRNSTVATSAKLPAKTASGPSAISSPTRNSKPQPHPAPEEPSPHSPTTASAAPPYLDPPPDGEVTYGEVFYCRSQFQNNPVTLTLTGAQIKTLLASSSSKAAPSARHPANPPPPTTECCRSPPASPTRESFRPHLLQQNHQHPTTTRRSRPRRKVPRITVNNLLADGGNKVH